MTDNNLQYYFLFSQHVRERSLRKALQGKNVQFKEICLPLIPVSFLHPPGFSFSLGLVQQGGLYNPHGRECRPWVCCQQNTPERSWHLGTFSSQCRGSLQPSLIGRHAVLQSHVLFWKVWYLLRCLLYSLQGKSLSHIFKVPLQICNSPEAEIWASHSISRRLLFEEKYW